MTRDLDRLTPALRPNGRNAGTQSWRDLLFLHWEVPPDQLRGLVPAALEIDTYQGRAYAAVVPFKMRRIRPGWSPGTWGLNFYETNVRTYVHYRGRPGVYFFSLDASSRVAVWAARWGWALPYYYARMQGSAGPVDGRPETPPAYTYNYTCRRGPVHSQVSYTTPADSSSAWGTAQPETLEHFLLERYLLFVQTGGRIHVGQVHHPPYRFAPVQVTQLQDGLLTAAGIETDSRPPDLAHASPGVDVEVFRIQPA